MKRRKRPLAINYLILANLGIGLVGTAIGLLLLVDPSGELLGLNARTYYNFPFDDFLIPGLIWLYFFGILPVAAAQGLRTNQNWALPLTLLLAMFCAGAICLQALVVGHITGPVVAVSMIGITNFVASFRPRTLRYVTS